jgi:hypothetical protein
MRRQGLSLRPGNRGTGLSGGYFLPRNCPLSLPDESGYNLMKNAHARRCVPEGPETYFLVQNRAELKQLVAGAAHLCKERVPEYLG